MDIYTIPYHEKYIVYRPLKRLAFVANAALVNLLVKSRDNPTSLSGGSLETFQFLDAIGFWEPDPPPPPSPSITNSFNPTVAVLFLTTACNFRCVYCYASGGEQAVQNLSFESGCQALDEVCQNALNAGHKHFDLNFHGGGEPTLARSTFRKLVDYARRKSLPCQISVASHGYWNSEERDWILGHLDNVSLSFDGIREVQDQQRPLASGQGSFETVLETIRTMDRRQFPYGIRLTVTNEFIDVLGRSIEFLCKDTSCHTFQIEPAFDHGRARRSGTALTDNERFAAAFLEAYDIAVSYGRHLYYSGARPWVLTSRFCQAPERALVMTPDGSLTACYEIYSDDHALACEFFLGKLSGNGQIHIDVEARQRFFTKLEERRSLCEDCFCYWHCAGDCPSKTFSGEGHLHFGARCELNRLITKELLIRYIAGGNGIWQGTERLIKDEY